MYIIYSVICVYIIYSVICVHIIYSVICVYIIYSVICVYIVTNSRPPACDRPRFPNSSRVAHRTDNSVVTFWNNARNQSRVGLQPHHSPVRILPARNRVNRRISIYLSTRAGNLPRDRTSTHVGLDTNRSSGPFRSSVITERVLSPDLAGSDSI